MNYVIFQQSLHKVLSDPSFIPPECLLDLSLKGDFKDLLTSCSRKTCVRFSVGEAKLVLPIFEGAYPDDDRPRNAILAVAARGSWVCSTAAYAAYAASAYNAANVNATAAARAARTAAYAAYTASVTARAADAASAAANAAYAAVRADFNVTLEDQLRRLFKILTPSL